MPYDAGALFTLIGLALLLGFFYGPWQAYCIDKARQDLFRVREQIFDLARAGKLSFATPEYRQLRASLEKLIRFAHKIDLVTVMSALMATYKHGYIPPKSEFRIAIEKVEDREAKQILQRCESEVHKIIMILTGNRSLFVVCVGWLVRAIGWVRQAMQPRYDAAAENVVRYAEVEESGSWQRAQHMRRAFGAG